MELCDLTIRELQDLLARKEVRACDILESCLKRIDEVEEKIRAFVTLTPDAAREAVREVDERQVYGGVAGIPCGLKDNLCTRGIRTTCSSRMLENFVPPYDATVVSRLREKNAVFLGKLNMDEFAMGSSTENSAFFSTRNPWDPERVPGGSSGGSAAAVAAGEVIYALGSDTGGSIRQPAAFCGVVGMKPTYGRVSRYGLVAFASSLDQIGTLTKDVTDCALVMNVISGHDALDSTSVDAPVPDYTEFLVPDIRGFKIGYPREYFQEGIDEGVKQTVTQAMLKLQEMGAVVEEVSCPHTEYALPAYYILAPAEASSNLARFDGVRYGLRDFDAENVIEMYARSRALGFGPEVKRRIMLGTYALSSGYYDAYYLKALKVRRLIKEDFDNVLSRYDVLVTPTSPTVAFRLNEKVDNVLAMYMSDIATIPVNLAGVPAISVPCGFVDGLPVGLQIIGRPLEEGTILRVAYAFEQYTGLKCLRPQLGVK